MAEESLFDDDALFCEEQEESGITFNGAVSEEEEDEDGVSLTEQDLAWDDDELQTLFTKEAETFEGDEFCGALALARGEAVEWILKINAHCGFSALTAVLAVNYLDRFLSSLSFQRDKPWMMQLASVSCFSLAAKVEETSVPLLLDLQVEGAKYVFEAKTIQRMELLVLSSLKWRMNPVTPLSFLDHIIRRLGLKSYLHWEFLRRCESLILFVISDSRFRRFTPSVLATATMLHVIQEAEAMVDQESQLLSVLKISKEELGKCYELLSDKVSNSCGAIKRNRESSVKDAETFSFNTDDSSSSIISSASSSLSDPPPVFKKMRVTEQQMRLVDAIGSPH